MKNRGRPEGLPKRWRAQRRAEVVISLLRGEDIGKVSRQIRVTPPEGKRCRHDFVERGQQSPMGKNRPRWKLTWTRATLGEMTVRVELQPEFREEWGYGDELRKLLRRLAG